MLSKKQTLYICKLERLIKKGLISIDDIKDVVLKDETIKRSKK